MANSTQGGGRGVPYYPPTPPGQPNSMPAQAPPPSPAGGQPNPNVMPLNGQTPGMGRLSIEDIQNLLATMPEAEQKEFLDNMFRDFEGEETLLDEQRMQAGILRDTPTPEGRTAGNVYTAANPMEHIGAFGQHLAGKRNLGRAEDESKALSAAKSKAGATLARAHLRRKAGEPELAI